MTPLAALCGIDWQQPWFAGLRAIGPAVAAQAAALGSVAAVLNAQAAQASLGAVPSLPRFCAPDLPPGTAYEQFIFDTGAVPTRDNLHDFFNGLVWLRFPEAKRRLNQLQAQAIAAQGVGAVRGRLRDAITVFDENGALLVAPPPLHEALQARDWRRLFVDLRPMWRDAQLVLFGHALLEKLVDPRKPITAHVYQAQVAIDSVADIDGWLAGALDAGHLATKPFNPLPVLGVPAWWAGNEEVCFYDDLAVFRPARPASQVTTGPSQRSDHGLNAGASTPIS